jgi:hypothetical protein
MIASDNFRVSREAGRARLDPAEARDSFGYYIDFANSWESFRNPEELLGYLGIHRTHKAQFGEILADLGRLTDEELDWARRYVEFFDRVGRLLSTAATRPELQFDIAETAFDWRVVRRYVPAPARVLDYGAGCGRQAVSAFLRDPDVIYTAVDSTLNAYTVQNVTFSLIDALRSERRFTDFLDLQLAADPYPDISAAAPGSIFHLPAWFDQVALPTRFYDVMFACHVHGELSAPDFNRLVAAAARCLADDGILYVRSELAILFPKGWWETRDLHGIDIVEVLRASGLVPVFCSYQCCYQTTVFARVGSAHHARAQASDAPEAAFYDLPRASDTKPLAGRHFVRRQLDTIADARLRVLASGRGFEVFESEVAPLLPRMAETLVLDDDVDPLDATISARIREFNPDVLVVAAPDCPPVAERMRAAAGGTFELFLHHVTPVCFSYRRFPREAEPGLLAPVRVPGDLERNRGERPRGAALDGGRILASRAAARVRPT